MFDAARLMSGEQHEKKCCIVDYVLRDKQHVFTTQQYDSGVKNELVLSNLMFDNELDISDISDTTLKQRENSCWSLEFAIHSSNEVRNIRCVKTVTFVDNRLWVSNLKLIKSTRWKHPYTEDSSGHFNARAGLCSNTLDFDRKLIPIGCDLGSTGTMIIERINKHGFLQVRTDTESVVQHLNNFDDVDPNDVSGIWYNDLLGVWMFDNTDIVNSIPESPVYLLLDTHSRQPRFYSRDRRGPVYAYDYTKARAFFTETEAINSAKQINKKMHTTFTVEQWI